MNSLVVQSKIGKQCETKWMRLEQIKLTLFKMGLFWAAHRYGAIGFTLSLNLSHISYNNETWHSYTLPKEDQKYV